MGEARTILVGVDGSKGSVHALRWALAEARLRGDTIEIVNCWHIPSYGDVTGMVPVPSDVMRDSAAAAVAEVLTSVADEAKGVAVTSRVELGSAARTLIDASNQADLLVVGRRGHGGFVSLVMGSVAQQVAAHAHCPVVIVAADEPASS